jgi:hypothetical protein
MRLKPAEGILMNRLWTTLVLAGSLTLWGCSSVESDWSKANAANTVSAYQQFLSSHPSGPHSTEAADRIQALQDEASWQQAKQANTADAYDAYLKQQPKGVHVTEAKEAQTAISRAADWSEAKAKGTAASVQDFLKKYSDGPEVQQARDELATLSAYKLKLGAARTQKQAQKQQQELRSKYSKVLPDVVLVADTPRKGYQLESTPMSKEQADSACSELGKHHQKCEVVKNESARS